VAAFVHEHRSQASPIAYYTGWPKKVSHYEIIKKSY